MDTWTDTDRHLFSKDTENYYQARHRVVEDRTLLIDYMKIGDKEIGVDTGAYNKGESNQFATYMESNKKVDIGTVSKGLLPRYM